MIVGREEENGNSACYYSAASLLADSVTQGFAGKRTTYKVSLWLYSFAIGSLVIHIGDFQLSIFCDGVGLVHAKSVPVQDIPKSQMTSDCNILSACAHSDA